MQSDKPKESKDSKSGGDSGGKGGVEVGLWESSEKAVRREFPGPRGSKALLRVAVDRGAYADLIAHAKSSLDKEICGVLAGAVCEDDDGLFVHVQATIQGNAASKGSTHVTFTQETWNQIHRSLERDYPKMHMVGWYHSHPGFGVEFSEMDLFIQRNFFASPTQVALVMDPMSGAVAICVNTSSGIQYVDKFWVDGREQQCQIPKSQKAKVSGEVAATSGESSEAIRALDARVGQLMQAIDDQRASYHRFLIFIGAVVCIGAIACFLYTYYSQFKYRNEPPQLMNQFAPVPVQIGDKTVLLGVGIVTWKVPEELNAFNIEMARERLKELEKEAAADTNRPPAGAPTSETNAPNNVKR